MAKKPRLGQRIKAAKQGRAARTKVTRKQAAADTKAAARRVAAMDNHAEDRGSVPRFQAANPVPKGELQHINPFTLLVAVVLSAQATDAGVNKATPALFEARRHAGENGEARRGQGTRFDQDHWPFRTKAKNVIALSSKLVDRAWRQGAAFARSLEALPGVGRKTANVVLNIAFGEPTIAVDTHIFRVGNRTGMATGKTPFEVERNLMQVVPATYKRHAHHWLILHGRYTCVARRPLCEKCIISDLCKWPGKTVA